MVASHYKGYDHTEETENGCRSNLFNVKGQLHAEQQEHLLHKQHWTQKPWAEHQEMYLCYFQCWVIWFYVFSCKQSYQPNGEIKHVSKRQFIVHSIKMSVLLYHSLSSFKQYPAHKPCTKLMNLQPVCCSLFSLAKSVPKLVNMVVLGWHNRMYNTISAIFLKLMAFTLLFNQKVVPLTVNDRRYHKPKIITK